MKKNIIILLVATVGVFLAVSSVSAAGLDFRAFNSSTLVSTKDLKLVQDGFQGVMDFSLVDLGGDNINEIIVSYGYQSRPEVALYRYDGSLINKWQPYPVGYEGKINLAAADFDGDGKDEIVTVPGEGGGPQVRVFDGFGNPKFSNGFFAYDQGFRGGLEVNVGDVNSDGMPDIIISLLQDGRNIVKFFSASGQEIFPSFSSPADKAFEPKKVASFDLNNDGADEIILGAGIGSAPLIQVFNNKGEQLKQFLAYAEHFRGGVDVEADLIAGQPMIVTAAGYSGGPHVRFFDLDGNVKINPKFFAYEENFRGGINVALGKFGSDNNEIAVLPQTISADTTLSLTGKAIKVDISEQRLYAYERGRLIKSFLISSGKVGFDTPIGKFYIFKKRPLVRMSWFYGPDNPNNYDLPNVPDVMSFKGPFTIHGAYWHNNWGHKMSHGCVNVSLPNADWLYQWTPEGTAVIIQN
ncbi:hypothetical protein A2533_04855 [Candidatus Falkowbacteria bacterium RIFOXYD2_FULL_35_9]|uniref:L,D-TPase catalytic domain-containing protein n=1 Tax=Candidatus Falkowbacteria bacterium RIFOXYC2_FULL_36_12 TaxID=1798002 RepID=A0A1F5SYB5_9BACT|nr:MAG: hypothetical protein A2300_04410 [Candidatus Falkowbacteria bacterium RIFOXYB2_FULL_35_7]OGF31704.1 MAG: hypothetical protein A2478_04420 [Candidatus Falkowbacteria bacterium RIFOXYC2_FULL_36_12]OGF33170.1 MAG: hypothetical protein A2223_04875 [Candidatus Falkowbacteria bacterium RIFOXYA2_FULL_35_8]OGF46184.1 MAG: hypothetical protein A2533_04855 [Candidatus Falkowbacteria bacterium RIFOXYD2_FULL_35_9]